MCDESNATCNILECIMLNVHHSNYSVFTLECYWLIHMVASRIRVMAWQQIIKSTIIWTALSSCLSDLMPQFDMYIHIMTGYEDSCAMEPSYHTVYENEIPNKMWKCQMKDGEQTVNLRRVLHILPSQRATGCLMCAVWNKTIAL